jgi:hypothetical protein
MRTINSPLRTAAVLFAVLAVGACETGEARAPNPTKPLDERRAIEVIRRAISLENAKPAPGREVKLMDGKPLMIDVGVEGFEYGVAYITSEDAEKAGASIPSKNGQDEKLRLARAGEDGEVRIVLLYQDNYRFDDLVGESHEQTTITAERLLTRDVQDFIVHAKTQKYK